MSANWWEAAPLFNEPTPAPTKKKEEQNWWEEAPLLGEATVAPEVAPVSPEQQSPIPFGPLGMLVESVRSMKAGAEGQQTANPILGATSRGAELIGSALETTARLGEAAPDAFTATGPAISAIKSVAPKLQEWADSFRNWGQEIDYAPSTKLGDIADNPATAIPFVVERVITSSPDMLAASVALPAYIPTRANEILNNRLKNDNRTLDEATIGDVAAAAAAATVEGTLERFATRQLGAPEGILRPTALQAGTEAVEEVGSYAGETVGTKEGFDPQTAALTGAEAAIVGGGLGGTIATATELVRRNIESRVRDLEGVGTDIEKRELQRLRDQAFETAQTIAAPELPEVTPVQYGDAYAQRVYDSLGQYIPINAEFKVEEKVIDGASQFVVTDNTGIQYGQALDDKTKADSFALSLNNTTKERADLVKQLEPLQSSLKSVMKGFGLSDMGLTLNDRIFTRRGEALTSEGLFDPVVRRVFLAVDAIDPDGTLDTNQRRESLRGVLRHEVVHALRYLDLWKRSEWKNLENAVGRLKKTGTDKTYLDIAKEAYGDQSEVIQVEEAVAEMIRDVADRQAKVAGRPRSLSERAINFFDKAKNALTGAGFQTYEDIVRRFEQGDIGARERGKIRTFRATEEQQAAKGEVPERLQRLFTNPEERNKFRDDTVQNLWGQTQPSSPFAANALRTSGIRESRSFIDPVPAKITVDNQEFPTRDSENRLIYSGYEGPEVFGMETRPTQEGLQNFWRSFKGSKAVDQQGRPQLYLHGTAGDITAFRPKQAGAVFVTRNIPFAESFGDLSNTHMIVNFPDFIGEREVLDVLNESMRSSTTPKFYDRLEKIQKRVATRFNQGKGLDAKSITDIKELYTGKKVLGKTDIADGVSSNMIESIEKRLPSNANLVPVYVNAQNPFDYENNDDVKRVIKRVKEISPVELDSGDIEGLRKGDWVTIEGLGEASPILDAIKSLGYDSMYIEESGIKNLAVFNPNQIKSAIGNNGNFDITTPSIRESRVQTTKAPVWVSQKVWDLHEKSIRADQEESGQVATTFPRSVLRRNSTMASRRLLDAVGEYLGVTDRKAPESQQQVIDFMTRMNEESGRREQGPSIRESRPETVRAPKKRNELIVRELFDYSTDDKGRLIVKKNIDKARQLAKKVAKPKVDKDGALVFKAADADDVVNALNNMPTADVSIASQVARRLNLSEEEINATSLPFQTGEPTNRAFDTEFIGELPDVVQYLEDRRLESGLRPLNIASEEDQDVLARLIAAETLGAIRSSGNALEWYDETIGKALGIASLKYPELQSDPNAQGIFTIAMAISSQGLNVENNFKFTFKQYDAFRRTGRFPETGEGEASGAMAKNFKLANDLMDEFGDIGTLRRFLATPFSVEELRRTGFNITDELGDEMVLGSSVFGPKIGFGFYSNLNGNFEPVTMDMWFMRLIGRLIGKLKQFDPDLFAEQLVTFRNSLDERGKQGIYADRFDADLVSRAKTDDEAALELARRVKKAHEKDFKTNRAEFDAGERSKTQLVNSSDRLINSVDKPKDAPANGTERRNLRSVVRKAVAEVERTHGERIPPAAMQALIWYPEQELYSALGVSLPVTSQDYAGAAQKLLEEEGYDLPTIRAAAESGARRTRQVAGKSVGQRPEEVGAEPQRSIPFEGREREEFIRRRYERTELEKERVAPRRKKVLFEVAPDPNNKPLTEAWRSLDNAVRLAISERIVQDMVPKVLSEFDTSGLLVNQVGSYLEDTNPSFALLLDKGDVVEVSKALGFALSQDSMMIVSPKEFKGGDLVNSITVELGNVSPQEIESIYNRLREIEVDGKNPVGGQTFTNGGMTILNYSDVDTATLADLIDSQLANKYTVYKSKVYSAFPEKKDYDYASERNDGRGQKAVLRKRLRDLRAEATNAVQEQLQGIATQGRAAAPAEAVVPRAREARRRRPPGETPLGPTVPGPSTDSDTTAASEALNEGQPTNGLGMPTGPLVTDTMPDNTVDISRARLEPLTRRLIRTVEFFQSAPDKLRSGVGLTDIAKRIEDYYDTYAERLGIVNGIIREANKNISFGRKREALDTFEEFIRARENGRTDEAAAILNNASESDRQLIDAWNRIAEETGRVNLSVRTPNGQPMKVYDPNLVTGTYGEKVGGFRPIRAVKQFFPRTLRREVLEVMMNSDKDPALYNELLDALIASGKVDTREEADGYLTKEWFSDEIKQDYFAGVEKARTDPLPEVFYDYSWDAATRYLRKWARRTSQIQYFGQEMGQFQKDWFDTNIPKVRDDETQEYLNEIKNRIYEIESFDFISNVGNWLNSLATATQLGNPVSASVNLLGGTITNVQEFGIKEIAKSYANLLLDWKKVQEEGTRLGILNTDVMNILSDHVEQDVQKYFSKTQRVSEALAKFTNVMLTFGGFNGAENVVRASAMLAARSWLNDSLIAVNQNPGSSKAKKFYNWISRENLNAEQLILENGSGPETAKFMRRAVNVPQGSYKIDMTPVFADTTAGRFFLKYQKFGTQVNRFFYRHFLKPIFTEKGNRAKNIIRALGFVGTAIIGGQAILAIREAFGYGDPGPDFDELEEALLENEDLARAWALILSRAWQNISAAGSMGNFANYAQFGMDWQDQLRPKNPLSPPGLSSIEAVADLFNRIRDQKSFSVRDLDEIAENTLSFYRAYKRIGLTALEEMGSEAKAVKSFATRKEVREIRELSRRYSDEMEMEYKRRTAPGSIIRTPMTPINRKVIDALYAGDGVLAREIIREAQKGLPRKEREKIIRSIQAAARNAQPIQIAGVAPSREIRRDFDLWARKNLPKEKVQLINRVDRNYKRASRLAGLKIGE